MSTNQNYHGAEIAVIGMSSRFPKVNSTQEFWQLLREGRCGLSTFSSEELERAGVDSELISQDSYVPVKGVVENAMAFDAEFFGYSEREAILMDPQLRLYHETAWQALEDAGCGRETLNERLLGVFGGASANPLWTAQFSQAASEGGAQAYEIINLVSRDFFNTRLAYKFNLNGPAVTVQSACSTGLVAIHQACQSLLSGDSDIALAGAVSLSTNPALVEPDIQGYVYQEGMILAPDGQCRPFDESAQGTVLSDGVGFVVLKRLHDAITDGDQIHAVIKGSAINNDGNNKVGYTAPSVAGQRDVLSTALQIAGVEPQGIGYIETHGTGTKLGDPIEVQALNQVYGVNRSTPCLIGSVKSNFGHLDTAAGIAGFIKAVLAIKHGGIPASLHYKDANQKCQFSESGLMVSDHFQQWPSAGVKRAGVSSFGIGGTNAHIILEEYRKPAMESVQQSAAFIPVTGHSKESLQRNLAAMQSWLRSNTNDSLSAAYTMLFKRSKQSIKSALVHDADNQYIATAFNKELHPESLVFMFSGQGSQYSKMAQWLYKNDTKFREVAELCSTHIDELTGVNVCELLWGNTEQIASDEQLRATKLAQLTLFTVEFAIAQSLIDKGYRPSALIGHSLGEYVAATVAGVFSLQDAIKVISARAQIMSRATPGKMIAVNGSWTQFDTSKWSNVSIATINSEKNYVVAGAVQDIEIFISDARSNGLETTELSTSSAFHSSLMDPLLSDFEAEFKGIQLNTPNMPIISNVTGDWAGEQELCDVSYWVKHLRHTVQFHKGISTLLSGPSRAFVEVGPGNTLANIVSRHGQLESQSLVLHTTRAKRNEKNEHTAFNKCLGQLYTLDIEPDWSRLLQGFNKIADLPPYQFDSKVYKTQFSGFRETAEEDVEGFYKQQWSKQALSLLSQDSDNKGNILVLDDNSHFSQNIIKQLELETASTITTVRVGEVFKREDENRYIMRAEIFEDYEKLVAELTRLVTLPTKIISFWPSLSTIDNYHSILTYLHLARAFSNVSYQDEMSWFAITTEACNVTGIELLKPEQGLVYGTLKVISQEHQNISAHQIDFDSSSFSQSQLLPIIRSKKLSTVSAVRGRNLWQPEFLKIGKELEKSSSPVVIRDNATYVITGGFGGAGQELARYLASTYKANLVLVSRTDRSSSPLIAELNSYGANVTCLEADVSTPRSAQIIWDKAVTEFGQVSGVFHLAGLPGETMVMNQTNEIVHKVLAAKLGTANAWVDICEREEMEFVVLFSSVTGILGGMGQSDYSSANAGLDCIAEAAHSRGIDRVFSIRWDAWKEAGMAVEALNGRRRITAHQTHPLLGDQIINESGQTVYCKQFHTERDWPLAEHWVMGLPTIPGATYLEMAAAAFQHSTPSKHITLKDVYFLSGAALSAGDWSDLYTNLTVDGNGTQFEITSYQPSNELYQIHAKGQVSGVSSAQPESMSINELINSIQGRVFDNVSGAADLGAQALGVSRNAEQHDQLMKYGERWNCFEKVWIGERSGLAKMHLPAQFDTDINDYSLHPALLDCATSYLRAFIDGGVYIPISYAKLTQYSKLEGQFYSFVELQSQDSKSGVMSFDICLLSLTGEQLVTISNFTMKKIETDLASSSSKVSNIPLSEFVYKHKAMPAGIDNSTAMSVIEQTLAHRQPVTLYAASDFIKRYENSADGDTGLFDLNDALPQQTRPRPDLEVDFVAAKTPTQKSLVSIWEQMLGLEKVGIQDDFFELGGDSLVLMQIHKKVQQTFDEKIAVVELYNYPTIQKLAEYIDSSSNEDDDTLSQVSSRVEKKKAAALRRRKKQQKD